MWFGCGSDVVRTCFRMWLGRVFGSGADSLAEVKGKCFQQGHLATTIVVATAPASYRVTGNFYITVIIFPGINFCIT